MKTIIKIQIVLLFSIALVACENEQSINENSTKTKELASSSTLLYTGTSAYGKALSQTDNIVGFSSQKENPLANEQFQELMIGDNLKSALRSAGENQLKIKVNGYDLNTLTLRSASEGKSSQISSWYGKNVSFVFEQKTQLRSGLSEIAKDTISMYIPNLVLITSPVIQKSADLYPYCYYKNFELHWNADKQNVNGLVVLVEWFGTTSTGKQDKYVRNIDIIEQDNGAAILNEKLFDGIPEKALTYITLLRGNVDVSLFNDQTYRTIGESHVILPIFLIRELK